MNCANLPILKLKTNLFHIIVFDNNQKKRVIQFLFLVDMERREIFDILEGRMLIKKSWETLM